MSDVNIESLSSLEQLLQTQPEGLYIDIYSGSDALQIKVGQNWKDLSQLSLIKVLNSGDDFVSGYNCQVSIKDGAYFYVFPGRGKGNMTIKQHREQFSPQEYSDASTSYSTYYGVFAVNGQTDHLLIQTGGQLMMDPDTPTTDSLILNIGRKQKLQTES